MKTDDKNLTFIQNLFKDRFNIDIKWCKDDYSRNDGYFIFKDKTYLVECKKRNCLSNQYPTTIINKAKYDFLTSNKSILVITFKDGVYVFKSLKKAFKKHSVKYCRSTTDFAKGVWKYSEKVELDLNKAVKINVDTNINYEGKN